MKWHAVVRPLVTETVCAVEKPWSGEWKIFHRKMIRGARVLFEFRTGCSTPHGEFLLTSNSSTSRFHVLWELEETVNHPTLYIFMEVLEGSCSACVCDVYDDLDYFTSRLYITEDRDEMMDYVVSKQQSF